MRTELVSIATDTQALDGAYYEPDGGAIVGAVQLLHGMGMNFYVGAPRFLPPVLTELGLACLAYNRRGHDVLSTFDSRDQVGGAFQTSAEAIADNRYAGDWLRGRGHGAPILIGHSNGGMLAVRHVVDHPDTPAMVLMSAHIGGKAISKNISALGLWAGDRYEEVRASAEAAVAAGRPRELIMLEGWWNVTAAASALDYLENVPAILELAPQVTCPVLYLKGDQEPDDVYPAAEFGERCGGPCDVTIVENCGHFYVGREAAVSALVADWLRRRIG